jgi:hypothetical protein
MEATMRLALVLASLAALTGCGQSDYARFKADYGLGYQNGYGVGFVNTCEGGRYTVSAGIKSAAYNGGYRDGHKQGELECKFEEG